LTWWEVAEEPWVFLSLAEEYYHCVIKKDRDSTSVLCGIDATCSGIQILSTISKDQSAAKMVNVLASDKPQDAYAAVAKAALKDIPERLRPYWDRKIVKRPVMTICYAAKE
jgi:DNA-directed RNA polymerase